MYWQVIKKPHVYWRLLGIVFTIVLLGFLVTVQHGVKQLDALAAIQMGDFKLAYTLWMQPKSKWSPETQRGYALMHLRGEYIAQDFKLGKSYLIAAADRCDPIAMRELGLIFYKGESVGQDFKLSYHWIHKAAQHGDTMSMNAVAWMYANGVGVDRDLSKALHWYGVAYMLHDPAAKPLLEQMKVFFKPEEFSLFMQSLSASLWQPEKAC